jgi:hypothetical protein
MPGWLTATLRWIIALAVAAGVFVVLGPLVVEQLREAVGFDHDEEELPEAGPEVGPRPLEAGRTEAVAEMGVSVGAARPLDGATVSVGSTGVETLLLGFEALPTDPACLAGVALEVHLLDGVETAVHTLPARVADLTELTPGDPLPANHLLDRTNPSSAYTTGASGWLRFDVRSAYQLAARAADGDLVVLAVTIPEATDGSVTFSTIDDRPARLRWAKIEGCKLDPLDRERTDPLAD